ncbi:MAG TPA: RNA polymerase sigma factor, partial [Flavitalea sp.]|nr:RNA polymerase sigma factor [Flavitalea sp.]
MSDQSRLKSLFESLHLQYYAMVLQMSLGYMKGDPELARDMAQEVFINIWNALAKFKGEASYKTWIYRITVNTCLLYIRSNKKKQTTSLEETSYVNKIESSGSSGSSGTETDQHHALYRAIGALPELDRLVMMMILDELEYDEISKITGINAINLR